MELKLKEAWSAHSVSPKPSYVDHTLAEGVRQRPWPKYDDTAFATYLAGSHRTYLSSSYVLHVMKTSSTSPSTTEIMVSMAYNAKLHGSNEREMQDSKSSGKACAGR
jgi:hypothetical protein